MTFPCSHVIPSRASRRVGCLSDLDPFAFRPPSSGSLYVYTGVLYQQWRQNQRPRTPKFLYSKERKVRTLPCYPSQDAYTHTFICYQYAAEDKVLDYMKRVKMRAYSPSNANTYSPHTPPHIA